MGENYYFGKPSPAQRYKTATITAFPGTAEGCGYSFRMVRAFTICVGQKTAIRLLLVTYSTPWLGLSTGAAFAPKQSGFNGVADGEEYPVILLLLKRDHLCRDLLCRALRDPLARLESSCKH